MNPTTCLKGKTQTFERGKVGMNSKFLLYSIASILVFSITISPALESSYGITSIHGDVISSYPSNTFVDTSGVLEFNNESESILSCNVIVPDTPEIKTKIIQNKDERLSVDAYPNDLFIILGELNSDSFQYLQIPFQSDPSQLEHVYASVLMDLKGPSDFEPQYRLFQSEGTLALVMESDTNFSRVIIESSSDYLYKQYIFDSSRDESSDIRNRLGPGEYDLNSIIFLSDKKYMLEHETCAFSLGLKFSVGEDGKIVTETPQIHTTKIRNIGDQFTEEEINDMLGIYYAGFYSTDNKKLSPIFEIGKEVRMQEKIFADSYWPSIPRDNLSGTVYFMILDNPTQSMRYLDEDEYKMVEKFTKEFDLSTSSLPKLFSQPFVPTQTGKFTYIISTKVLPDNTGGKSTGGLIVVEKFGKSYAENNGCKENFTKIIKPIFSSLVCVSLDTYSKLLERGWIEQRYS